MNMQFNKREIIAVNSADYFTCINWKPLGNKERFEFKTKEEAIKKGNKIVKDDTRAKVLIYAVKDTNYALTKGIRGSSWK